jgi:phosphoglycolate phosphatase
VDACVIFDLDGTLIDTAPGLALTMNALLESRGRRSLPLERIRPHITHGTKYLMHFAMKATGTAVDDTEIDRLYDEFLPHYRAHMGRSSILFAGAAAALDALAQDGYRLGVCSNRFEESAVKLLDEMGIRHRFAAIVGQDSIGIAKPDPAPLLETLRRMDGRLERSIFIGDTDLDIAAANAAGMKVIAARFGYGGLPATGSGATGMIDHFDELPTSVKRLLT